jgi:hypothetical protein
MPARNRQRRTLTPHVLRIPHSAFRIPHSAFRIPHSAFRIPHSAFRIPHSALRLTLALRCFTMVRVRSWVAWAGLGLVALALVAPLGRFFSTSSLWLDYPYTRTGSEGLILYETLLARGGGDIYAPITAERFISGPYPPVYYWLAALSLPDSLPDFSDPARVTALPRGGRIISLIATCIAAALVALFVIFEGGYAARPGGRNALLRAAAAGIVGGALLLTLPQVLVWATRFRGDMLMLALTAAGLVCVAAGAPPGDRSSKPKVQSSKSSRFTFHVSRIVLPLGALFFALAFFTKQTALAGPLAAGVYLLLRDWRLGLRWCALAVALVVVPFAALDIATGHWFFLKMVVYHSLPFSRVTFTRLLHFAFWDEQWPLIVLAVSYSLFVLAWGARAWRTGAGRIGHVPLLAPLFVLASLVTLPTGAVVGADHNHLLMPGLALCMGVGSLLAWLLNEAAIPSSLLTIRRFAPLFAGVVILLGVYSLFTSPPAAVAYGPDLAYPSSVEQEQMRKIALYVRDTPGEPFYADDQGILALAGKQTPYDDPFTMTALAGTGRWDESVLRDMLRQGKFARLVLSCDVGATLAQNAQGGKGAGGRLCRPDVFTPGVLDAINAGYKVLFRDVLFTYEPR